MPNQKSTPASWLWPDHTLGKRESRRLSEEHNTAVNLQAEMAEALREVVQLAAGQGRLNLMQVAGTARAVLAKLDGGK